MIKPNRNGWIVLTALMAALAMACGDDDEGGGSPFAPSGMGAPADTATAASGQTRMPGMPGAGEGDEGMRSMSGPDTRMAGKPKDTINFNGVSWDWNGEGNRNGRYLFPDSTTVPSTESRVILGNGSNGGSSNVWKRADGSGLIRILSNTDLSGFSFETAEGRWDLSQRRVGLYVSEITTEEVEQIRAGGASGGRDGGARTTLVCWPEVVASYSNPHLLRVPGIEATTTVNDVVVVCNQDLPKEGGGNPGVDRTYKVSTDNYPTIRDAAQPDRTPAWITPLDEGITGTLSAHSSSRRRVEVVAKLTLVPNPSRSDAREGTLDWDDTSPSNRSTRLDTITVVQERRGPPTADGALALSCKTVGCAGAVTALERVELKLAVTGLDSDDVECGIEEYRSDCTWRIRKEPVGRTGQRHAEGGRFLATGTSTSFTWEAPARPAGSASIPYHAYAQIETNLGGTPDRSSTSNSIDFTVNADNATVPPRMIDVTLSCAQDRPRNRGDGSCLWDVNNAPRDGKIIVLGHISTDPPCTGNDACWGTPEWRYSQVGAERRTLTPGANETLDGRLKAHAKLEWKIGSLRIGDNDQVGLGTDSPIGAGGTGTVVNIQVRDTNEPPEIGRADDLGRRIDGITCDLVDPHGQDQVDPIACTVLRGFADGASRLRLRLAVKDPDSELPSVEWSGRGAFTPDRVTTTSAYATWDSAGLSPGQYTLTATVTENRGAGFPASDFRATRTVTVRVEDYEAPPEEPQEPTGPDRTMVCDPNYRGTSFIGDLYCGQRHATGYAWTGFTDAADWLFNAVGTSGAPSVELVAISGYRLRQNENRICGIARGVCGGDYSDTSVHSEDGNTWQWINVDAQPALQ